MKRLLRLGPTAAVGAAIVIVTAAAVVLLTAAPAGAHGLGGPQPTNYRTDLTGLHPPVPGIRVRVLELGDRIELTNRTSRTVVVLGYEGEPYLRITRRGVWENRRSPATYLNRSSIPPAVVPTDFDAAAPPDWHRRSQGDRWRWHDHRAHWMDERPPPAVRADPGRPHVVIEGFAIPLRVQGVGRVDLTGDVRWIPGPSPWRALGAAVLLAVGVATAGRTRAWPVVVAVALGLAAAAEGLHVVGAWRFSTAPVPSRLGATVYSFVGIGVAVAAIRGLWRNPWGAVPAALVAGIFVLLAGGLAGITALTRSQVPTMLPTGLARTTVVASLGLGTGIVVTTATRLRLPTPAVGVAGTADHRHAA